MTIEQFRATLEQAAAPETLSPALRAMWEDAKGRWNAAHAIAQDIDDQTGSWIHAYLHRKEGDLGNAGYWYRRADKPVAHDTLDEEWDRIVSALLSAGFSVLDHK
ncbi:MAG TPA: hypothetical protein VFO48_03255 [Vicinamibacterales bacterium]|nr:hypothetical protein [Vicinamibacterales bacterium]